MRDRYLDLYSPLVALGAPAAFPKPNGPVRYNFGQGLAAPETFPMTSLAECCAKVFGSGGPDALEYFDPAGEEPDMLVGHRGLREDIAQWIKARQGAQPDAAQVILTLGSAQGLALVANTLVGPGDGVIVEETTFRCALHYLRCAGGTIASVPLDEDGMSIDAVAERLEEFARRKVRPKLVYTIPTFHLPTGTVLAEQRRRDLLALAEEWNIMILEDNVYAELRYDGTPVPSLLALDTDGRVIQSDSFSKMIAPGIRLGWLTGPREVVEAMTTIRQDLGVSQIISRMMSLYLRSGELPTHLQRANAVYRRKRDAAVAAMEAHCNGWARYRVPSGSFYLWIELEQDLPWDAIRAECLARGVYYRPGEMFASEVDQQKQHVRLAYSYLPEDDIDRGIAILGEVVGQHTR